MFIRFLDENDNIAITAFLIIITIPIWGPFLLLLQGIDEAQLWLYNHANTIYIIFGILILAVIALSIFISIGVSSKKESLFKRISLSIIPSIGTVFATYNLYRFVNIAQFKNPEEGFMGLFSFIVWLICGFIAFLVVIVAQLTAPILSASLVSDNEKPTATKKFFSVLVLFLPYLEIVLYYILD